MASDHVVSGADLYRGELQLMTISHFIAQNLLLIYLCIVDSSTSLFEYIHFQPKGCLVCVLSLSFIIEIPVLNGNSVDPDQTPRSAASDLG